VPDKVTPDRADALGGASEDQLLDVVEVAADTAGAAPAGAASGVRSG
jgi:hypothetical protein